MMDSTYTAADWLTYYVSPRMNQIQAALFAAGVREPKLSRLVHTADRLAGGKADRPLWVDGGRFWLLFARRGYLRIDKKAHGRRPTLRQVEQLYG